MKLVIVAATLLLLPLQVLAQTTDTTNPVQQELKAGSPLDSATTGPAIRDSLPAPTPATVTTPSEQTLLRPAAPKSSAPVAEDKFKKAAYITRHVLMGVGAGSLVLCAVVAVVAGGVLLAIPSLPMGDDLFPKEWRQASAVGLLAAVVPGLLIGVVGGAALTGISAFQTRSDMQ